jgi:hypothetical protein
MHDRGQLGGDRGHLMGFHAEDDDILHPGLSNDRGHAGGSSQQFLAIFLDQLHAILPNGLKVGTPEDERDVMTAERQLHAEHAADGTGAYDTNSHDGASVDGSGDDGAGP